MRRSTRLAAVALLLLGVASPGAAVPFVTVPIVPEVNVLQQAIRLWNRVVSPEALVPSGAVPPPMEVGEGMDPDG